MRITCQQLADRFRRFPAKLMQEVQKSESQTLVKARVIARRWSSGTIKTPQLVAMGHPYAKRRWRPPQDPGLINVQTGRFKSSWTAFSFFGAMAGRNAAVTGVLLNTAPYSGEMEIHPFMGRRPIVDRIVAEITPIRQANLEKAIQRAMR